MQVKGVLELYNDLFYLSDKRKKNDIEKIENGLKKLEKINAYSFFMQDDEQKRKRYGVVAQEVMKTLPELVHTHEDGHLGVAYNGLIGILIDSVKELQRRISHLENLLKIT